MMASSNTSLRVLLSVLLAAVTCSCTRDSEPLAVAVIEPSAVQFTIVLQASLDTNRNIYGRPSPVLVHVFQLDSKQTFEQASFSQLSTDPEQVLGSDLLGREKFLMRPGDRLIHRFVLLEPMRHIGVIAEYRDVDAAQWRALERTVSSKLGGVLVSIGRHTVEFPSSSLLEQQPYE